ncbi:MAG: LppX_LprAFG lipoprotein [Intrasporangium sp.]|uniref:LppX_LprAFG lipoprotein n=1 Tax=Intrasporangium sp. TaxID=1925024 RepID=UPI002648D1B6|nr:LppX_LprAFG lipoprotein [Intrasporangium sp.]MDN5797788.1 LppX_LprAFG lipoprotein [Intrasporangium sp.]
MRTTGKIVAALLAGLCLFGTAACTGDSSPPPTEQTELTPAQRLDAAKSNLDAATSVHVSLTSAGVPEHASGLVSGEGWGAHPPAFKGTFKVAVAGVQADAEITSVDGKVWARLPLVPGTHQIAPADYGLPDPAVLFSRDRGLTTLITATTSPTAGGQTRKGSEVLTKITGDLPGSAVVDLLRIGEQAETYHATYLLTDANQLRQVSIEGPFFGSGTSSAYTLVLDRYGEPVTITRPT